jgi:phage terminase large subunit
VQNVAERIYAARSIFTLTWFDQHRCARLIECLQHYRWKERTIDATGHALPVHDWASHGADAFGQLAFRNPRTAVKAEAMERGALRKAQQDTDAYHWATQQRKGRGGY